MADDKNIDIFTMLKNGILIGNPVLRLALGICPVLAVTTSVGNALGMGIAATLVLICSNTIISLLRKIIPDKVRVLAYITIIAGLVSMVQLLVRAYVPALDKSLGIYLPLITVNCIILGRAERFASKHKPFISMIDGLAMGIGFTAALLAMGVVRELVGAGSLGGARLISETFPLQPMAVIAMAPGGFFVFGMLVALTNHLTRGMPSVAGRGCERCPAASDGKGGRKS